MEVEKPSLSEADLVRVREKQRAAKLRKQLKKEQAKARTAAAAAATPNEGKVGGGETTPSAAAAAEAADIHPASITQSEYFDACPAGLFRDPSLVASDENIEVRKKRQLHSAGILK